jgi:hypothetical protein
MQLSSVVNLATLLSSLRFCAEQDDYLAGL